ncbi:MAG: hypothetical protein FWE46_02025 [Coriobacteriia bacterium]|nr:hypothetical protein [Coriobacteriia bacterium]MCL2537663.1 hypothetical protein [Coriobacteriia bacterium]
MKNALIIVAAVIVSFTIFLNVTQGGDTPRVAKDSEMTEVDLALGAEVETEAARPTADERDLERLVEYAAYKNEIFEGLCARFTGWCHAEGTVLYYTYTFYIDNINLDALHGLFERMTAEGPKLLEDAQANVPACTALVIEFRDCDNEVLETIEFR